MYLLYHLQDNLLFKVVAMAIIMCVDMYIYREICNGKCELQKCEI